MYLQFPNIQYTNPNLKLQYIPFLHNLGGFKTNPFYETKWQPAWLVRYWEKGERVEEVPPIHALAKA